MNHFGTCVHTRKWDEFSGIQQSGFRVLFGIIFIFTQNVESETSSLNFCMVFKDGWGGTGVEYISCYERIECF